MKRRDFLAASGALLGASSLGAGAQKFQPAQDVRPLVEAVTHGAPVERGGIEVELPALAENGNSVPLKVRVPSPMTPADHVEALHVYAERNPRPVVATFHLGPQSGRAEVQTRLRLAGSQKVTVLAALSGGRFRMVQVDVVVTSAACLDEALADT